MTLALYHARLQSIMAAVLRAGRKKITTSFVMNPELHTWFRNQYPNRGEQSHVLEELVKKLRQGLVTVTLPRSS